MAREGGAQGCDSGQNLVQEEKVESKMTARLQVAVIRGLFEYREHCMCWPANAISWLCDLG